MHCLEKYIHVLAIHKKYSIVFTGEILLLLIKNLLEVPHIPLSTWNKATNFYFWLCQTKAKVEKMKF